MWEGIYLLICFMQNVYGFVLTKIEYKQREGNETERIKQKQQRRIVRGVPLSK